MFVHKSSGLLEIAIKFENGDDEHRHYFGVAHFGVVPLS